MKSRNTRKLVMYGLMVALLVTSVAYAALQTVLNINGTVTKKGGSWNIYFTNVSEPTITGKAEMAKPTLEGTTNVSFSATLTQPLDKAVFTVDVVNDGSLDAQVSSVVLTGVDTAESADVSYTVTYADGTEIKQNDTLKVDETKTLKVTVEYDDVESISGGDVTLDLGLTLIYVQSEGVDFDGGLAESTTGLETVYATGDEVYFNPEEGTVCEDYVSTQSNAGVKTGCMKWYAYNDTGSTVNLFLDHNTTNSVAWQSSGDTRDGIGEVQTQLLSDTSTWQSSLGARLITYDEVTSIAPFSGNGGSFSEEYTLVPWLDGYYWTSTPVPSTFFDEYDATDGEVNGCREDECYYQYAYSASGYAGGGDCGLECATGLLIYPVLWNEYHEEMPTVSDAGYGVRPVITVTR